MAKNSFAALANGFNKFSRKFGTDTNEVVPYISGAGFIHFATIPTYLPAIVNHHKPQTIISGADEIRNILESCNVSCTIPGKQLNTTEFTGLGGITWSVPTNVTTDTTLSMRFWESSDTPILSIFHGWVRMIRDSRSGVSLLVDEQYKKSNYASNLYYWTTKPDGESIEYAACFSGLYPTKDPSDLYGYDVSVIDKLEVDMDFKFDYMWEQDWVYERCLDLARSRKSNAFPVSATQLSSTSGEINSAYRPSDS